MQTDRVDVSRRQHKVTVEVHENYLVGLFWTLWPVDARPPVAVYRYDRCCYRIRPRRVLQTPAIEYTRYEIITGAGPQGGGRQHDIVMLLLLTRSVFVIRL